MREPTRPKLAAAALRDLGSSSLPLQPRATFGDKELYPDLAAKVAARGHALISKHPFVDGNKRVGMPR